MLELAIKDLKETLQRWRLWVYLGWFDIRMRYRLSILGPWWITLSTTIFVAALSVVYSKLFHQDPLNYLPFLISGMILWGFLSTYVVDSTNLFKNYQNYIKQIKLPYLVYPLRHLATHLIIFTHNLLIYPIIALLCRIHLHWNFFFIIPALLLILLNLVWVSLLLGLIGCRFRDIPPAINSIVQVLFFISPVTWLPKLVGPHSLILQLNPITYLLDLFRAPLLGYTPEPISWIIVSSFCIIGCTVSFFIFVKYRNRIAFWVE